MACTKCKSADTTASSLAGKSASCTPSKRVGADGMTKQQRWVKKNRVKVNAKNAIRNRVRRQQDKQAKLEEAEIVQVLGPESEEISDNSTAHLSSSQHTNNVQKSGLVDEERPEGYYTSNEYYQSQEFDDLMHQKLLELEALEKREKAEKVYEEAIEQYDIFQDALKQFWSISSGWVHSRRFKGSNLEEACAVVQRALQEADELNSEVLRETPTHGPLWLDIYAQVRDLVGKRTHLHVVYHSLMDIV